MPNKELTVDEWFEEINNGLEFRKLYGLESSWAENEALFSNVAPGNIHAGPNLIYSTGDSLMSTLSVPFPYITVKPRRQEFTVGARLTEDNDNNLIESMEVPDEIQAAALSAYLFGPGIIKIGYDSEFGWDPSFDLGLMYKRPLGMTLTQYSKKQDLIEFGGPDPGMPWLRRVLPHDFVVPWGTMKLKQAAWCAHRVVRHIDDCKADPKYNTRGLKPVMSMKDFVESYKKVPQVYRVGQDVTRGMSWGDSTGDNQYVELWEIHDQRTRKVYVVATGNKTFLRNEVDYIQLAAGLPFIDFTFTPRTRTFWVTSDAYYLKAIQNQAADIALQKARHRKVSNLKFLYGEDMLDLDELERFQESEIGACIKVNGGQDIRNAIMPMTAPQQYNFRLDEEDNRSDAQEMIGFSRNQMGEYTPGRRTAAEANIVQQASSLRMDRRQGELSRLYCDLFKKVNAICQEFWQVPRWVELLGQDGGLQMAQFTGQNLKGDYKLKVGFSLDTQETIQQRRANAIQLYMALRQDPLMNPFQLARFLNLSYNDPEFSSLFQPGVLNGQIEALSAMQGNSPAGGGARPTGNGNGAGGGPPRMQGAQGQGQGAGTATNKSGSVQAPGVGTR